jgi:mono/diheme cytochrome c family protein
MLVLPPRAPSATRPAVAAGGGPRAVPAPAAPDSFAPRALTPFESAKARRLLDVRLACLGCHALRGRGGRIGPALDGAGSRLDARRIWRRIAHPSAELPGSLMPAQPMDEATRALIANFLGGERVNGVAAPVVPPAPAVRASRVPDTASAATLYARHCAACHGDRGYGDGFNARYLPVPPTAHASAAVMGALTDGEIYDVIDAGGRALGRSPYMPAWGAMFTPEQIHGLVRHIRRLCQCEAPSWSRDTVAKR